MPFKPGSFRALGCFRRGQFDLAGEIAQQEKDAGSEEAVLTLGLEALSRRAIDTSLSYFEPLLARPTIGGRAARFFWIAAKLTRDVETMRRAEHLLAAHKSVRQAATRYLRFVPEGCRQILRVDGNDARLPFLHDYPLPAIEATINGYTVYLLVDNGASELVLSQQLAERLQMASGLGGAGYFAGGTKAQVRRAFIDHVTLGGVTVRHVPAAVFEHIGQISDQVQIDGILGSNILGQFSVAWNFLDESLELTTRTSTPATHWRPARVLGSHVVVVQASLAEVVSGLFFLDVGGTFGVALDRRGWRVLMNTEQYAVTPLTGVAGAGAAVQYQRICGPTFRVDATDIPNVTVVGGVFPEQLKRDVMTDVRGIFSFEVLSSFARVEIDLRSPQVALIRHREATV